MNNRKGMTVTIIALIVAVFGLTVAYAALSTTLNVKFGNVVQQAASWDIHFETIDSTTSITPTTRGTSATGRTCGKATLNSNVASSITIADTTLSKPGDSCEWADFYVYNQGTIAGKLSSITTTAPTGVTCSGTNTGRLVCGNITYSLINDATGAPLASGVTVAASTDLDLILTAEYTGTGLNTSTVTHTNPAFTLNWVQA